MLGKCSMLSYDLSPLLFIFSVLGMEPKASHVLGKYPTTKWNPHSSWNIFEYI